MKDYDRDKDDFSLGQGQMQKPELGNWMYYEFFSVNEDGVIGQFGLSTEDGKGILTMPGEYSKEFEAKDGQIYYTGFYEEGQTETMTFNILWKASVNAVSNGTVPSGIYQINGSVCTAYSL